MVTTHTQVRRRIAVQFAFSHLFYPAMINMVVGLVSIVLLVSTEGRHGTMPLLFVGICFLALLPGAVLLSVIAYWHPNIARKQIDAFIKTQQTIVTVYEESQATLTSSLEGLEEEWDKRLKAAWRKPAEQQKKEVLDLLDQGLTEAKTLLESTTNADRLRNQARIIELLARIQESEESRELAEAIPIPEMPEELFREMKQGIQPYLQSARETLLNAISKLGEQARDAQEALAEAQKLT